MADMLAMNKRMMTEMVKTYFSQTGAITVALLPEQTVLNMDVSFKAKDGSKRANGRDITFPDGRTLFMGSSGTGAPKDGRDPTETPK